MPAALGTSDKSGRGRDGAMDGMDVSWTRVSKNKVDQVLDGANHINCCLLHHRRPSGLCPLEHVVGGSAVGCPGSEWVLGGKEDGCQQGTLQVQPKSKTKRGSTRLRCFTKIKSRPCNASLLIVSSRRYKSTELSYPAPPLYLKEGPSDLSSRRLCDVLVSDFHFMPAPARQPTYSYIFHNGPGKKTSQGRRGAQCRHSPYVAQAVPPSVN